MSADEQSIRPGDRQPHRVLKALGYSDGASSLEPVKAVVSCYVHGAVGGIQINAVYVPETKFGGAR
jgi:hypothetical protein